MNGETPLSFLEEQVSQYTGQKPTFFAIRSPEGSGRSFRLNIDGEQNGLAKPYAQVEVSDGVRDFCTEAELAGMGQKISKVVYDPGLALFQIREQWMGRDREPGTDVIPSASTACVYFMTGERESPLRDDPASPPSFFADANVYAIPHKALVEFLRRREELGAVSYHFWTPDWAYELIPTDQMEGEIRFHSDPLKLRNRVAICAAQEKADDFIVCAKEIENFVRRVNPRIISTSIVV